MIDNQNHNRIVKEPPEMGSLPQRMMTSEGRVSDNNLYGNLTGVKNRIATSVASNQNS